jgi:asparagine synthase (glutamine-hydrolysing)
MEAVIPRVLAKVAHARREARLTPVSRRVRAEGLTYLSPARLQTIEFCVRDVNRRGVPGDFIEAGVALGGSAVVLATLMGEGRSFHGFDVFGMIPPPGPNDPKEAHDRYAVIASGDSAGIGGDPYYGYVPELYDRVVATFARYGRPVDEHAVSLHRGLYEDTLRPSRSVALAHVDSDWYQPVRTCLERIAPHLSIGGYIVLDDYFDYGGCRRAVDEFLALRNDFRTARKSANIALLRTLPDTSTIASSKH